VTLFLDANVIIYLLEGAREIRERVIEKLSRYQQVDESARIAVSRLSWLECRVRPLRDKNRTALAAYDDFFSQADLIVVDLTALVVEAAAQIRAALNFSTPDALQAACALQIAGPVQILSNDRRFSRIPGITVVAV
jgi:predicted nucleic acid-binding protein